jgi:mannose-6-phosphate isomerase-like protein (cupin superfamily)
MTDNFENRPWGSFYVLIDENNTKVKKLVVNPGQRLSLQSHAHRNEHWVIVAGEGEVTLDASLRKVAYGDYVLVEKGARHRVRCVSTTPLEIIEVQTGEDFAETDITRYEDDYNRTL